MMKRLIIYVVLLSLILGVNESFGQSNLPKREYRAAWVATVLNIDWPGTKDVERQKETLIDIIEGLHQCNINAIFFQVRAECDAFYDSPYEPWSYWLTGNQGTPPDPYYDPLAFAIEEAHKRGMELHAWFNPYRAQRTIGSYTISNNHVIKENPEWVFQAGTHQMLDPGLPQVREYVVEVISDVVRRYDVDGVHMDDYFYPYPPDGITNQDNDTFSEYPRGFHVSEKDDWRRDNVNLLISMINDSVKAIKPYVKFGMSPFGIWKSGIPSGTFGLDAYSSIYCDGIAWLQDESIDYLTPQLYWPFGGGQDFGKLFRWWGDSVRVHGRHFYPGHGVYRIPSWSASEAPNQIRYVRSNYRGHGSVLYNTTNVLGNPKGFTDSLKNNIYKYPALPPVMTWLDTLAPNPVKNLRFEQVQGKGYAAIQWDLPDPADDGDTGSRFVIYKFDEQATAPEKYDDPFYIAEIAGDNISVPESPQENGTVYYSVTALDRTWNESEPDVYLIIEPPAIPQLAFPENGQGNQPDETVLRWHYTPDASSYDIMVSDTETFNNIVWQKKGHQDTVVTVGNLLGEKTFYWKVKAYNPAGKSDYSEAYSFETGFPSAPMLISPAHATTGTELDVTCYWSENPIATSYRFQLAKQIDFNENNMLIDTIGVTDTMFVLENLESNSLHFWRIAATNEYGTGEWSEIFGFKTKDVTDVDDDMVVTEYGLDQNYPNPFNPATTISYQIPEAGFVSLRIYNSLGEEIAVLKDSYQSSGRYEVTWNAQNHTTGIYFYELRCGDFRDVKKMILMK